MFDEQGFVLSPCDPILTGIVSGAIITSNRISISIELKKTLRESN